MSFPTQIFEFVGSKQFQVITISLLLPILLFLIEDIFKVREKMVQERKEKQLGNIKNTEALWGDIGRISGKFIYMGKFEEEEIVSLQSEINEFIIRAEEVVNSWHFEFSNLEIILKDDIPNDIHFTDIYLAPFNVLLSCITSNIDFKDLDRLNEDKERTHDLQEYIMIIYEGVKGASHHSMMSILKNATKYSESPDDETKAVIKKEFNNLKDFSYKILKEMYSYYPFDNSDIDFKEIENYLNENKENEDYNYKTFKENLEGYYYNLPDEKRIYLKGNYQYPDALIKRFADILKIQELSSDFNHTRKQYMALK